MGYKALIPVLAFLFVASCQGRKTAPPEPAAPERVEAPVPASQEVNAMAMQLTSSAFQEGGMIPRKYTCDGQDLSPPLAWEGVPEGAKSLALICDDPDAPRGTWVHWVLWNLPADARELSEGVPTRAALDNGAQQGNNSWPTVGYRGPCPPSGTHRYYFKLYALDSQLQLKAGATKADLLKAMEGHILAQAQLMGKYAR